MPPWTDGDGRPDPDADVSLVQLIEALSALAPTARTVETRTRVALRVNASRLDPDARRLVETIAESCELLGPSTTRAIRVLVSILGTDIERIDS